jgi:ABC-type Mn2+/Zn2+ transport system permease subunit
MVILIVGALVAASLISRLVWLIARRWPDSIGKAALINAVSAMITVIAAAYGSADGGPPKFYLALLIFGGAQLIVLTFDVFRLVKLKPSAEPR